MKKSQLFLFTENVVRTIRLVGEEFKAFSGNVEQRLDRHYFRLDKIERRLAELEKKKK